MNRLALCRKGHSHLVTLLSGALILSACAVTTQVPLSQTDNSTTAALPIEMRPLSPTEKAAFSKALSRMLTNPDAAQFKWLPVATYGSGRSATAPWSTKKQRQPICRLPSVFCDDIERTKRRLHQRSDRAHRRYSNQWQRGWRRARPHSRELQRMGLHGFQRCHLKPAR